MGAINCSFFHAAATFGLGARRMRRRSSYGTVKTHGNYGWPSSGCSIFVGIILGQTRRGFRGNRHRQAMLSLLSCVHSTRCLWVILHRPSAIGSSRGNHGQFDLFQDTGAASTRPRRRGSAAPVCSVPVRRRASFEVVFSTGSTRSTEQLHAEVLWQAATNYRPTSTRVNTSCRPLRKLLLAPGPQMQHPTGTNHVGHKQPRRCAVNLQCGRL